MKIIKSTQAREQNLTYYFTGRPCKHGHIDKRFVRSGVCYSCHKANGKARYRADPACTKERSKINFRRNRSRVLARNKQWYKDNKEAHLLHMQQYYEENKSKILEQNKGWYQRNPGKYIEYHRARRHRIPRWAANDERISQVYQRCKQLNLLWGTNMEVDHIIPLRGTDVSGLHVWENLQLLDRQLNTKKGNKNDKTANAR